MWFSVDVHFSLSEITAASTMTKQEKTAKHSLSSPVFHTQEVTGSQKKHSDWLPRGLHKGCLISNHLHVFHKDLTFNLLWFTLVLTPERGNSNGTVL